MGIIAWIVLGLIAGALAKLIYPGHQGGGILATMVLGIVGAFLGLAGAVVGGVIGGLGGSIIGGIAGYWSASQMTGY